MNTRAFFLSALISGVIMAVLGSLPIINCLNCLLCLWVWVSAILAVFLYRRIEPAHPGLSVGQGAALGAVSGVIGAILVAIISSIFSIAGWSSLVNALRSAQLWSSGMDTYANTFTAGGFSIFRLMIDLILYTIFGAVGGLIATAVIWKGKEPQPV